MRNVGQFEMEMSLLGGINSSNYILPEVTTFLVEIIPADATLSTQKSFSYPYGFSCKGSSRAVSDGYRRGWNEFDV